MLFRSSDAGFQTLSQMDELSAGALKPVLSSKAADPRDLARIHCQIGTSYFNAGLESMAMEAYHESLVLAGDDAVEEEAFYGLGYAQEARGWYENDLNKAVNTYQAYLEKHPQGQLLDKILWRLGELYARCEDYDSAALFFQRILDECPESEFLSGVRRALAEIQGDNGLHLAQRPVTPSDPGGLTQICGPVALSKMLAALGKECTESELARTAGTDETGTSMYGLVQAARAQGVILHGVQAVRGEGIEPPFIAYVNGDHFVYVSAFDPETGYRVEDVDGVSSTIATSAFKAGWDGKALVAETQPGVAQLLNLDTLKGARGGLASGSNLECRNGHCPCASL